MNDKDQARTILIQGALEEIRETPAYSTFKSHAYYVLAKLGLHLKSKEVELFEGDKWFKSECREELLNEIQNFLDDCIK